MARGFTGDKTANEKKRLRSAQNHAATGPSPEQSGSTPQRAALPESNDPAFPHLPANRTLEVARLSPVMRDPKNGFPS